MLKRRKNIFWHNSIVTRKDRENRCGHPGMVLWFTGFSGSGKSTLASALEDILYRFGIFTYFLDGDNLRYGLCSDLGFSISDRKENIRRVGEVVKIMVDAGLVVLAAFVSPTRNERRRVRTLFSDKEFFEVFVDTPLSVCEARDPKGLYKEARMEKIQDFTGIDSEYEIPENPEIHLRGEGSIIKQTFKLLDLLRNKIPFLFSQMI